MLYGLNPPKKIIESLKEVVYVQMTLLSCAARATDIEVATPELAEKLYICKLEQCPELVGRGENLVKWVFGAEGRSKHIRAFAERYTATSVKERQEEKGKKVAWCRQLISEVEMLLDEDISVLTVKNFFGDEQEPERDANQAPEWKRAARSFLLYFYDNYLGTDTKFPEELFANQEARLGREDFLEAFLEENKELEMCPVCDQTHYYTHSLKGGKIHATLDHFLPKSFYPHFACHPYNLVPTCHGCNSSAKGAKDPFLNEARERHSLNRRVLPYHGINLRKVTYLEVNLSTMKITTPADVNEVDNPRSYITLGPLRLRDGELELPRDELDGAIKMLSKLYDIPDSWGKPEESNRIRATLFRRMRQFLGDGKSAPQGSNMPSHVHNLLHLLLYYLDQEYQQKDPHAFAMTWMLVAFMREHTQQLVDKAPKDVKQLRDPFLEEIVSWYGQNLQENEERAREAAKLLKIPKETVDEQLHTL